MNERRLTQSVFPTAPSRALRKLVVVSLMAVCLWPSVALAQSPAPATGDGGGVFTWLVTAGAALLVCAGAFLNPKRSHLD